MRNLHKFYYKDYFKGVDFSYLLDDNNSDAEGKAERTIKKRNQEFCDSKCWEIPKLPGICTFDQPLDVLYPGLVTGIGINHEAAIKGEFKLGVHFDWTYGMPVIYGSSVKGVLRAYFKEFYEPQAGEPDKDKAFKDIFDGGGKSIYDRDIFFDAVIKSGDNKGRILCSDSITPHGGEKHNNPLVNPKPITFLKIASGCKLEFRFKLVPTEVVSNDGTKKTLSIERKKTLFREILTTVGIGAKTNVGYGQLK